MKNLLIVAILFYLTTSFTGDIQTNSAPIEGGWELVWGQYGDNIRSPGKPYQFKLFSGRHYSLIMENAQGEWTTAAAGTYELEGDIYRETIVYNSFIDYVGLVLEWKYEVKGDTLIIEGPLKVTDTAGNDALSRVGGRMIHMREIRVRAK